ncbi:MAG: VOC family protein [Actinomycetota bacterium]
MPELDHLIFAATDLDAGVAHIAELTGSTAVAGGRHPGVGTHNALLTFDEVTYFEIIAIDPSQDEPERPRPFGLDDGAAPRLAGWAMHPAAGERIEDLVAMLVGAGHDPGPVLDMSRARPDGTELSWRLTIGDPADTPAATPFAIDWGASPSPALSLPSMGGLVELRVEHPDAAARAVAEAVAAAVDQTVVVSDGAPRLTAVVDTPGGRVEIS